MIGRAPIDEEKHRMDLNTLRGWQFEDVQRTYSERDTMLYALGLGLGSNTTDPDELRFVTEKNLRTLPMMTAVVAKAELRKALVAGHIDVVEAYHGEQRSVFDRPLPPAGVVIGRGRFTGIWDKGPGRGTVIENEQEVFNAESGERIACLRSLTFCRRDGGHGGDATETPRTLPLPATPPDTVVDYPTVPQAALIYRLSGDLNPLHSDPAVARQAGFPRPILHGYCTYGIAGWVIIKTYCDSNPDRLAALDARFSAPVFPGETLRVEMWRAAEGVRYRVRALERDLVAVTNGLARIRG